MLTAFFTTLAQMARILLFLVLGFGINRLHILPKDAGTGVSRLVTSVLLPAMLLHTNMTEFDPAQVSAYGQLVLLGGALWVLITVLTLPVSRYFSKGDALERGVWQYGLSFPNTSAVGMPIALAILGVNGLFQFNLFVLVFEIMTYVWGVGLFMEASSGPVWKRFLKGVCNPICLAMVAGIALGALDAGTWMPTLVTDFLGELGSCYVPVALVMAGYTIASYPLSEVFRRPKAYIFTLLRLLVIPVLVLLLCKLLNVSNFIAVMAVFAFAGPSGMNVVVFPAAYGRDCRSGASNVLLSSLGSILTIPLLYALVQLLFP